MSESPRLPRLGGLLLRALSLSTVGVLAVALLDARWASAETDASLVFVWLNGIGLLGPALYGLAVLTVLLTTLLHAQRLPALSGLKSWLQSGSLARQRRMVAALVVAPILGWLYVVVLIAASVRALTRVSSSAVAAGTMGLSASVLGVAALVAGALFARAFSKGSQLPSLRPGHALAIGIVLLVALFGGSVALGATSGTGGFLAEFGVLKRPELDLRAPALLLGFVFFVYLSSGLATRLPSVTSLALLLPIGLTIYSAVAGMEARPVRLSIERYAPLSRLSLGLLQRATDRDGDGFSRYFGGGDCDDANEHISPAADDIPDNGVDEDCSGADAPTPTVRLPAPPTPANEEEWITSHLPKRPNLLLLTVDTLRSDLGYTGYSRPVSPNLDALAKRSTVFEKAYALASYTGKSVGPTLIGKYPSETHRDFSHFNSFGKEDTFVQQRLQKAGIHTVSVQGHWYFFHERFGLQRGFSRVDSSAAPKMLQAEGDRTVNSDKLSDAAIDLLRSSELSQRQFFMWVHYLDPHAEYVKHEEFDFGKDSRAMYDGEVAFVDKHVGRVLKALSETAFADRTLIIVTSDHGEAFGEHGIIRHGRELWEEMVRVPLIIHVPHAEARSVSERRSLIDLVPTILQVFGVSPKNRNEYDFVSGQSLLKDVLGPPGYSPGARPVFIDMSEGPNNAERQALIENDLKVVASNGRPLNLFDLSKDPGEKRDLLGQADFSDAEVARYKEFRRGLRRVYVKATR